VNTDLLVEPQEKALAVSLKDLAGASRKHLEREEYSDALTSLAGLREPVDAFFDGVMVNVEDTLLRDNRLNLLKRLRDLFLEVADISQLVVGK
jgi:glycyl-tRNA synthetase beta chain